MPSLRSVCVHYLYGSEVDSKISSHTGVLCSRSGTVGGESSSHLGGCPGVRPPAHDTGLGGIMDQSLSSNQVVRVRENRQQSS